MKDTIQLLRGLGFTEYESKVYLALLKSYPATGYAIAKNAGVPRSMVYEALGRLDRRGAVMKAEDEAAAVYRPVDPDALLGRESEAVASRLNDLRELLTPLYESKPDERLWTIPAAEVARRACQMTTHARSELLVMVDDAWGAQLSSALIDAERRGVSVGAMLTGEMDLAVSRAVRHPKHETRLHHMERSIIVVRDEQEFLVAGGSGTATITMNSHMVLIARQFIWMELFSQRIFATLGDDLRATLSDEDRRILERS